jgi:hypothetical protein
MRTGTRLKKYTIEECFLRVRQEAGVRRAGASYQPRLHDLRHSAACPIMPLDALDTCFSGVCCFLMR